MAESALLVSLPHISSSATAKVCKLHQIVVSRGGFNISSQGAINIRNSAKFTDFNIPEVENQDDLSVFEALEQ